MQTIRNRPLLRRERIAVSNEFDMVRMQLGNVEVRLPYDTALQLAAWLRLHGRKAKRFAGDTSTQKTAVGILTDLNNIHR